MWGIQTQCTVCIEDLYSQWHSQDEQVMWALHGHIQCARTQHTSASVWKFLEIIHSEISSEAIFGHKYHSFSLSLHVHMKVITHANNWSLTLTYHIIFTRAPVNFTWAQTWVCLSVATPYSYSMDIAPQLDWIFSISRERDLPLYLVRHSSTVRLNLATFSRDEPWKLIGREDGFNVDLMPGPTLNFHQWHSRDHLLAPFYTVLREL